MKKIILTMSIFLLTTSLGWANTPKVEFEGRYWFSNLDANATVTSNGIGTKLNFKSDLGIEDENFPEGRFTWYVGPKSKIRLSYMNIGYDGDHTLTRQVDFNGRTYTVGSRVISSLDVQYLRLGWAWQFIRTAEDKFKLGLLVDAKGIMADVSLNAPSLGFNESKKFAGGLPTVGVALDINPMKKINLFAEISGIGAGSYGHFFDAEAGVKFFPCQYFSIFGGYRIIDFKLDYNSDSADLKLTGPFAGATLRF